MSFRIVVDGTAIGKSLFEATIDPSDVRRIVLEPSPVGQVSVLVLSRYAPPLNGRLEFETSGARVLQIGESDRAIFIMEDLPDASVAEQPSYRGIGRTTATTTSVSDVPGSRGDQGFISELPDSLRATGEKLLREVRRVYPGSLVHHEDSKKYVEGPDNFWTVKIQPRAGDLAITVRGNPKDFVISPALPLKQDRPGYSRFKISRPEHVDGALKILAQARKRS